MLGVAIFGKKKKTYSEQGNCDAGSEEEAAAAAIMSSLPSAGCLCVLFRFRLVSSQPGTAGYCAGWRRKQECMRLGRFWAWLCGLAKSFFGPRGWMLEGSRNVACGATVSCRQVAGGRCRGDGCGPLHGLGPGRPCYWRPASSCTGPHPWSQFEACKKTPSRPAQNNITGISSGWLPTYHLYLFPFASSLLSTITKRKSTRGKKSEKRQLHLF